MSPANEAELKRIVAVLRGCFEAAERRAVRDGRGSRFRIEAECFRNGDVHAELHAPVDLHPAARGPGSP